MEDYIEEINHLQQLKKSFIKRLRVLELKEATLGLNANPEISIEMENIKQRIAKIDNELLRISQIMNHLTKTDSSKLDLSENENLDHLNATDITNKLDRDYSAELLSKSHVNTEASINSIIFVEVIWKNTGRITWTNIVRMGPNKPKERFSRFYSKELNWFAPNRIIFKEELVAPNNIATFRIPLAVSSPEGVYREHFGLLVEDYRWLDECPTVTIDISVRSKI